MPEALSAEFRLVLACTSWPPSEQRNEAVRRAVLADVNWQTFTRIVDRHRVWGLAYDGLTQAAVALPPEFATAARARVDSQVRKDLAMAAETIRLQRAFDNAGIAAGFVKGATLAILAFGQLSLRHSKDIDLLVNEDGAEPASALLERLGYARSLPPPTLNQAEFRVWLAYSKECAFVHRDTKIEVELHSRLSDNPFLLASVTAASATRQVTLTSGAAVRTLSEDALFAYLCVHGAAHSWFRLKWLCDIAALLAGVDDAGITALYDAARALGAGRSVDQALLLCERLYGVAIPAELSTGLRRDHKTRWLVALGLKALTRGNAQTDIYDATFGTVLAQLGVLLLRDGPRFYSSQLWHAMIGVNDVTAFRLLRQLWFMYPILRFPLWLWRRVRHRGRHSVWR